MDRHAKENHIVTFSADDSKDEEKEEEEQGQRKMMMISKIDRKTSETDALAMANNTITPVGLLDIMRESSTLLRSNSSLLMWVMLILICPLSALLLSATLLHSHIAMALSASLHSFAAAAGLLHSSLFKALYTPLSQTLLSYTLCSPLFFTTWLLAKAFIIFTVSSTYSARKPSLPMFISIAFKLWKRLFYTYVCVSSAFISVFTIASLLLFLITIFLRAIELPADLIFLAEMGLGLSYSVILAHMVIIANLATVVCILEEHMGMSSLIKSLHLIRGRTQVALSLVLATTVCKAMVESLYQYRVIGVPEGSYVINTASRLWEGPLLILMYSFLYLYDAIMSCVFYFTCKSACPGHLSPDGNKQAAWQHISIGMESTGPKS